MIIIMIVKRKKEERESERTPRNVLATIATVDKQTHCEKHSRYIHGRKGRGKQMLMINTRRKSGRFSFLEMKIDLSSFFIY